MITLKHVAGFAGLMVFAAALYWAKSEAQAVRESADALQHQVNEQRAAVRVLEAEATYQERLDRLEGAARGQLKLEPVPARAMATLADLDMIAPLPGAASGPAVAVSPPADATREIPPPAQVQP